MLLGKFPVNITRRKKNGEIIDLEAYIAVPMSSVRNNCFFKLKMMFESYKYTFQRPEGIFST